LRRYGEARGTALAYSLRVRESVITSFCMHTDRVAGLVLFYTATGTATLTVPFFGTLSASRSAVTEG